MNISISFATVDDVSAVTLLRCNVAKHLTDQYGRGHWSSNVTEKSVLRSIKTSRVIIAKVGTEVIGSLRLATKKPWAIDLKYFVTVNRPLYLHDLAVASGFRNLGPARVRPRRHRFRSRGSPSGRCHRASRSSHSSRCACSRSSCAPAR